MELKIRNVDAGAVARIDEVAKKKGMSRNQYLKVYIENLAVLGELKAMENKYELLLNKISKIIENNTDELERIREFIGWHNA